MNAASSFYVVVVIAERFFHFCTETRTNSRATKNCLLLPRGTGNPLNLLRDRDRGLQFFPVNEEFPVSASHKLALITSLPFVHTARRYYRLNDLVRSSDRCAEERLVRSSDVHRKDDQT
uniref:Uncharacterized protein n=1 Tax=Cacopsylla melanoneura TaxID=428564 RepID=A0A8D8PWJ7_9HEMI